MVVRGAEGGNGVLDMDFVGGEFLVERWAGSALAMSFPAAKVRHGTR